MSIEIAWIEQFTGVNLADPQNAERTQTLAAAAAKVGSDEERFERRRQAQAERLVLARQQLNAIKAEVQTVLSQKIPSGPFKGKSFLEVKGEQIDEVDVEDPLSAKPGKGPAIPDKIVNDLIQAGVKVGEIGEKLREAQWEPGPGEKAEDLFTAPELQAEFWIPVSRERIIPEGFTPNRFSATQQMIDETNRLYLDMVEQKKIAGQLTPERDFLQDALDSGGRVLSVVGEAVGGLGGKELEQAQQVLQTTGEVLTALAEVKGQLKDNAFADAASGGLNIAAKITGAVLAGAGVDPKIVSASTGAIGAGSTAILMGKAFARIHTGEATLSDALVLMGDVLAQSLTVASEAIDQDSDQGKKIAEGLAIAARSAPAAFKAMGLASDLPELVRNNDFAGIVTRLGELTKDVLGSIPGLDSQIDDINAIVDLGAAGLNMTIKAAISARKGDYLAALNGVIDDVGSNLEGLLTAAGVDEGTVSKVVGIYQGSASATKAIQLLAANPPQVKEAAAQLSSGLALALAGTGDSTLEKIGASIDLGVQKTVAGIDMLALFKEGKYDDAMQLFEDKLASGFDELGKLVDKIQGKDSGESDGDDSSDELAELVEAVKEGVSVDPAELQKTAAAEEKRQQQEQEAEDMEQARLLLAEAQHDLKAMTEAEAMGAEASSIDAMIADLLRDRLVLKMAMQIAQGGAAFLAKFVPALGAVSAGIKLAANLVSVAQRAQQVDRWIKAQGDLRNAQSALSSAAANFVMNQGTQLAHYSAQAFFAAAQLAGEITKLAGPAAPIGEAISSLAVASGKAEEILYDLNKKGEVEVAWKATLKALRNPGNRRLGLEARRLNPSLAKYSIAWGALILKDPLARNAMKACGLTEASLKNPGTDVNKVVSYLETFYEDDPTLYRDPTAPPAEWMPETLDLTLLSWSTFRRAAEQSGGVVFGNVGAVEGLLGEYLPLDERVAGTTAVLETAQNAFTLTRKTLREAAAASGQKPGATLTLPPIDDLVQAIDDHAQALRDRARVLAQLQSAFAGCTVAPGTPGDDANAKAAQGALTQLQVTARRSHAAAVQEEQGLETSKLELQTAWTTMKAQLDKATVDA